MKREGETTYPATAAKFELYGQTNTELNKIDSKATIQAVKFYMPTPIIAKQV